MTAIGRVRNKPLRSISALPMPALTSWPDWRRIDKECVAKIAAIWAEVQKI